MNDLTAINDFARKYLTLYCNGNTRERDVDIDFPNECLALGFQMDAGESFIEKYSQDSFYSAEALADILDQIDDPDLLGSAILSKWRYITHWSQSDLTSVENRSWFILALLRLKQLAR